MQKQQQQQLEWKYKYKIEMSIRVDRSELEPDWQGIIISKPVSRFITV